MSDAIFEITVKMRINMYDTLDGVQETAKNMGFDSVLGYIQWLTNEEGLMGIVDTDGVNWYDIVDVKLERDNS
jgi:hypothetical protein